MKTKDLILRCYARKTDDQWVAVCIDLCLAAQATSFQEAKRQLVEQIMDYVEEALTVDREFAAELHILSDCVRSIWPIPERRKHGDGHDKNHAHVRRWWIWWLSLRQNKAR